MSATTAAVETLKRGSPSADGEGEAPPVKKARAAGEGEAPCKTKEQLDAEWADAVTKKLISESAYSEKWTLSGPIKWGMWRQPYERTIDEFKACGEAHLLEKPFYALFATWARVVAKGGYIGSFELQLWIHSAILGDLLSMGPGKARKQVAMLVKLRDSSFSKGAGGDFATICNAAIKFIMDRNSPLVGGKVLLWQSGERFAVEEPHFLVELQVTDE
jgi:hypothetical protein